MLAQQNLVEIESGFLEALKREGEYLKEELAECRKEVDSLKATLESIWSDEEQVEYELCSVFIHRGSSPSFGHYFFYSRDLPDHPDRWLKYNDQDVSTVQKSEVLADTTGSTANPYLVCPFITLLPGPNEDFLYSWSLPARVTTSSTQSIGPKSKSLRWIEFVRNSTCSINLCSIYSFGAS